MTGYVYRGRKHDPGHPDLETLNAAILTARTQDAQVPVLDICGPAGGWLRHRYRHERPCQACRDARAAERGTLGQVRKTRTSAGRSA